MEIITAEELILAKKIWIMAEQDVLKLNPKYKHWHSSLNVFTDENGLLRCMGRLENALIPFDSKNPVLLSTNSYLTRLIVEEAHEIVKHNGVRETLTELLRQFWIPRGRNFIQRLIHQCRLYMGKPYNYPEAPPLPESRVQDD